MKGRKKEITLFCIGILIGLSIINCSTARGSNDYAINIYGYVFSTFLGGSGDDVIHGSIVDSEGNIIIIGVTSADYPTENAYQNVNGGGGDSFVTKLSSNGQEIIFSTFLGGSEMDLVSSVNLDNEGNIVVTGETQSSNFPTLNPIQASLNGTIDMFIAKFDPSGALLFSSYFGGSGWDTGRDISFDSNNSYIFTGHTSSSDFPVSGDAFQNTYGGGSADAFIIQLSADGQTLLYSTFLGEDDLDGGTQVTLDSNDCAIVCGITNSTSFNTTLDGYQTSFNGGINDCFITCFDLVSKQIKYSTFFGGNGKEMPWGIKLDSNANLILTGYTNSNNFPTSVDAYQTNYAGNDDIFVLKFNNEDYTLNYSTFLGGSNNEYGNDLLTDENGFVYVVGHSDSADFPVSTNAIQGTKSGYNDATISVIDPTGKNLTYSTFIGGSSYDYGSGISIDSENNLVICGATNSYNFPLENPLQANKAGLFDNTISKFSLDDHTLSNPISITMASSMLFVTILLVFTSRKRRKN